GRQADPTGLNNFVQLLQSGGTVEQLKAILGSSQEFTNNAQAQDTTSGLTTANQKFVDFLFQKILNRTADSVGLTGFTSALGNGATDEAVIASLVSSAEYLAMV